MKNDIKCKVIKSRLLKLYKKQNPSYLTNYKKQIKNRTDLIQKQLNFPLRFFKDLEVGDFACGSGDFGIIAAKNGAKVRGYDFNSVSIDGAKQKCKKLKIKNASFFVKEFFEIKSKFDFLICTNALHHLPNPYTALKHLKSQVKKDGFLLLSFGLDSSNLQHSLIKSIVRNWGTKDADIIKASKYLFSDHINRCVKYGMRTADSVIHDQFINSQHYFLNIQKVYKILGKHYDLHSTWPPIFIPRGDSAHNNTILETNNHLFASELLWSTKTLDDLSRAKKFSSDNNHQSFQNLIKKFNHKTNFSMNDLLNNNYKNELINNNKKFYDIDFSFGINEHNKKFYTELNKLFSFFKRKLKSPTLKETKNFLSKNNYIFKNTNGLGINYFIFKKKLTKFK